MSLGDIVAVAESMVAAFGDQAAAIMDARALGHVQAGDDAGAQFWSRIAEAVRELTGQRKARSCSRSSSLCPAPFVDEKV